MRAMLHNMKKKNTKIKYHSFLFSYFPFYFHLILFYFIFFCFIPYDTVCSIQTCHFFFQFLTNTKYKIQNVLWTLSLDKFKVLMHFVFRYWWNTNLLNTDTDIKNLVCDNIYWTQLELPSDGYTTELPESAFISTTFHRHQSQIFLPVW